jgi:maltooligosyltrehalose trehalohydrolase
VNPDVERSVRGSDSTPVSWAPRLGAWVEQGDVRFRVWAPDHAEISVVFEKGEVSSYPLQRHADGTHGGLVPGLRPGARYKYQLPDGRALPDPASRFQPHGVHGPSQVIDPQEFSWTDSGWSGRPLTDLIIYELHVGAFSQAGTFAGVAERLEYLAQLGITAIELMPIAEFAGRWNWGYDGVDLFAPSHRYGTPDDLRRLIDAAHGWDIAVILDVVYNHLGPDGAYLSAFSPRYFTDRHQTPWGSAVNLDADDNGHVREFFIQNALHWIHEYHADGLRLDATHELRDDSRRHFLEELTDAARSAVPRHVVLMAEDERNLSRLALARAQHGYGLDGIWADDFHHQVRRRIAGDKDGYFRSYGGATADIARTIQSGWFFTGQIAEHTGKPRGTDPSPLSLEQFIITLQNHDQIGNRPFGDRLTGAVDLPTYRAASALLLCAPETPLLFMGQEWGATTPFLFFTDHHDVLGQAITVGRRSEFAGFPAFVDPAVRETIPDPQAPETFAASRLRWDALAGGDQQRTLRLYQALLRHRRHSPAMQTRDRDTVTAVALDEHTVAVWRQVEDDRIVLIARLSDGAGTVRLPGRWQIVLSTEDPEFTLDPHPLELTTDGNGILVSFGRPSALLLRAVPGAKEPSAPDVLTRRS